MVYTLSGVNTIDGCGGLVGFNQSTDTGHSLALKADKTVWAWGANIYGQLGNNSTTDSSSPIKVNTLSNVVGIGCGRAHSLAIVLPPPGPPLNFDVQPGPGVGQIQLSWQAPDTGGVPLTGFKIYRGTTAGNLMPHAVVSGATFTYTDSSLSSSLTNYYYKVTALNPAEGPASNVDCNRAYPWLGQLGCIG
ncbi:MAG: fibronectin type III domain-containing protein [Actinobacteria bacterium]|nr:fibronectin type III domain-containing protein [Actinomycetota bacterium]